jgi:hypothetical protein
MLVAFRKKSLGQMVLCSPAAIDQYEETTASLAGFQRYQKKVILLLAKGILRRNQDEYVLSGRIRLFTGITYPQTSIAQN